jgi:hypothetical protein
MSFPDWWRILMLLPLAAFPLLWLDRKRNRRTAGWETFPLFAVSIDLVLYLGMFWTPFQDLILGPDDGNRLRYSILAALLLALVSLLSFAMQRRWYGALASMVTAGGWLLVRTVELNLVL